MTATHTQPPEAARYALAPLEYELEDFVDPEEFDDDEPVEFDTPVEHQGGRDA